MNHWIARILALALAAGAVYLVYANLHAGSTLLECTLTAAVLAIATIFLVWKRPVAAAILNAVWLAGAFVGSALLTPNRQLPDVVAQSAQTPMMPVATNQQPTVNENSGETLNAPATALPSLKPATGALSAPQPGDFDYSDFIGHGTIDDGMPNPNVSKTTTHAVGEVLSAFGGPEATPLWSPNAQKLIDADARIPLLEYSLPALAQTLPADPIAIYRFVRDNIAIDPYDGVMRGPLGTWMSRSGSASDKLSLLAWLLVNKHVHIQFVRSTLSDDERNRIVQSATSMPDNLPEPEPSGLAAADAAAARYVRDGNAFAQWSSRRLTLSSVALGKANAPQISEKHYWIQIDRDGKPLDLDPTLLDSKEGQHLGTLDASFKPWAMLPADEYHYLRVRVTAKFADGSEQQLAQSVSKTCDVAYAPLRLLIAPSIGADSSQIVGARKFVAALLFGEGSPAPAHFDLDSRGGLTQLTLEIDRKNSDGQILVSSRKFLAPGTPREQQALSIAGLTSFLVVPGIGANAFGVHAFIRALAQVWNAVDTAKDGKMKPTRVYPVALGQFFARDELVANQLNGQTNGRFYRDRANVALERTWYTLNGGTAQMALGFDIVDNGMAAVGIEPTQAAVANLARGYADTEIESEILGGTRDRNTIAVFQSAFNNGVSQVVVSGNTVLAVGDLAEGLNETIASGHVAIAPSAAVTVAGQRAYGWWDVDPSTGSVVGRVTGGAGVAMPEYGTLLQIYGDVETAAELVHAYHECTGNSEKCGEALCGAMTSSVLLARALEHSKHIHKPMSLIAAIIMDVGIATAASFTVCAAVGPPEPGPPHEPVPVTYPTM